MNRPSEPLSRSPENDNDSPELYLLGQGYKTGYAACKKLLDQHPHILRLTLWRSSLEVLDALQQLARKSPETDNARLREVAEVERDQLMPLYRMAFEAGAASCMADRDSGSSAMTVPEATALGACRGASIVLAHVWPRTASEADIAEASVRAAAVDDGANGDSAAAARKTRAAGRSDAYIDGIHQGVRAAAEAYRRRRFGRGRLRAVRA